MTPNERFQLVLAAEIVKSVAEAIADRPTLSRLLLTANDKVTKVLETTKGG